MDAAIVNEAARPEVAVQPISIPAGKAAPFTGDALTNMALAAALATLLAMSLIAWWAAGRTQQSAVSNAASAVALHLDNLIEPHVQDLKRDRPLSAAAQVALSQLVDARTGPETLTGITIWDRAGRIAFSTGEADKEAPGTASVQHALQGHVRSEFVSAAGPGPRLKIYAPMHDPETMNPIAVAEVHQTATVLDEELRQMRWESGGLMLALSLVVASSMFAIIRQMGRALAEHRKALGVRVGELSAALAENNVLQKRLIDTNKRSANVNDRQMKRISAELHDGPVQLIALALLRLEGLKPDPENTDAGMPSGCEADLDAIESALRDALKEIRGMSSGLALPSLENATLEQAIEYAVMNHEARSRTRVKLTLGEGLPRKASSVVLTSAYRFVQEGLNNAVRHAKGKDQEVKAYRCGHDVVIDVCDSGPGFEPDAVPSALGATGGLGLIGLRDRIEALGGKVFFGKNGSSGTRLSARFSQEALDAAERESALDVPPAVAVGNKSTTAQVLA